MTTEQLKGLVKRTLKYEGNELGITDKHVDYILDICDDNYQEELNVVIGKFMSKLRVYKEALGEQRFNEVKEGIRNER